MAGRQGVGPSEQQRRPAIGQVRIFDERRAEEHLALQHLRGATLGLDFLERRDPQEVERAGRIADRPQRILGDADLFGTRGDRLGGGSKGRLQVLLERVEVARGGPPAATGQATEPLARLGRRRDMLEGRQVRRGDDGGLDRLHDARRRGHDAQW